MQPAEEVAPHEAVTPAAKDVEVGAAGDEEANPVSVGVEEALQQLRPLCVLVRLVWTVLDPMGAGRGLALTIGGLRIRNASRASRRGTATASFA